MAMRSAGLHSRDTMTVTTVCMLLHVFTIEARYLLNNKSKIYEKTFQSVKQIIESRRAVGYPMTRALVYNRQDREAVIELVGVRVIHPIVCGTAGGLAVSTQL